MLQNPVICWTRQLSTDPRVPRWAPLRSKSLHVTWERLPHSGLIWSNIMSQAISWLRRELDLQMSGWHQSQYPHWFAHKCMKNCARDPASAFILIGGCIISCSPSELSFPAPTRAHTPPTNFVVFDLEAEQLISPQSSSCGRVPQIPERDHHCLRSVNCPVEGEGVIKPSSVVYREAIANEWLTLEGGHENTSLGGKS